jgi:hypothetical protein
MVLAEGAGGMKPAAPEAVATTVMHLSVREIRMIVERILLSLRLPDGFVPEVRDCILYSQVSGLGGLAMLKRDMKRLRDARPTAMRVVGDGRGPVLDAAQQHAWIVAPSLLDLALADFRIARRASYDVTNVFEAHELSLLHGFGERYGARIDVAASDGRATVRVIEDGLTGGDGVMAHVLTHGTPVPASLWQELYACSHDALTPDSIESRRHAGPVMVDAQGRVHGRDDDDTDFTLLGVSHPNPAPETA